MAKQKKFRVPLNAESTVFSRVEFAIEHGQVLRFVVQDDLKKNWHVYYERFQRGEYG